MIMLILMSRWLWSMVRIMMINSDDDEDDDDNDDDFVR